MMGQKPSPGGWGCILVWFGGKEPKGCVKIQLMPHFQIQVRLAWNISVVHSLIEFTAILLFPHF